MDNRFLIAILLCISAICSYMGMKQEHARAIPPVKELPK